MGPILWNFWFGPNRKGRSRVFLSLYFIWATVTTWFFSQIIGTEMDATRHTDHVWSRILGVGALFVFVFIVPILVKWSDILDAKIKNVSVGANEEPKAFTASQDQKSEEPEMVPVSPVEILELAKLEIPSQDQLAVIARCKAGINYILRINEDEYADLILFPLNDQLIRAKLLEYYTQKDYRVDFVECHSGLFCIILRKLNLRRRLSLRAAEKVEEQKPAEAKAKTMVAHA